MELSSLLANQELIWKQARIFKREYELRLGPQTVAKLYWPKMLSQHAIGEMDGESWTFERRGFLHPKIFILQANGNKEVGTYEIVNWLGKGFLILNNNQTYQWKSTNVWSTDWAWQELYGTPVLTFKPKKSKWTYSQWLVKLEPNTLTCSSLNLLSVFGFYLLLQKQNQ